MKISCPSCQSSYKIADEKVQGRTVKVRCRKCGLMIHVNERGVTSDTADAGGTAEAQPGSAMHDTSQAPFSVLIAEGEQRDMTLQEVVAAYNSGQVTADTFVWADGQPDWMPLAQVPAIVDALNAASAAVDQVAAAAPAPEPEPPAPEPAPAPSPSPAEAAPLKRSSEPLARASAPAPQPAGGLFGAAAAAPQPAGGMFGAAAAAPQPAGGMFGTPAPAAAVREERRAANVDLFGQARASVEDEVATSAPAFAPIASPPKATGARDEQSVLFSLAALTAAAQSAPTGGGAAAAGGKDDSGLIDLKALSNQPATGAGPAAMPGPVAILDAAPVLGTPIMDTSYAQLAAPEEAPAKKSYGLIIGIGVAVAGLAIAGAIVFVALNKSGQQNAAVTAPTVTETAPAPTPTPTPPPPSTEGSAAAPATGAPTTTAAPTSTGKSAGPRSTGGKSTGGTSTKGATTGGAATPPPATTKAPPKNKCNCPPGDLACNMACAVH